MHVLEENKKLSESLIWRLQREFFERSGPEAWSRGTVPQYVTSNPFIANVYAEVVWGFVEDCYAAGIDASQPLYILEVAAGSGRFAFSFMRRLLRLRERSRHSEARICYVMSDFAERNVQAWQSHPSLAPWVERGLLDFARFDGAADHELLLRSGRRLAPGTVKNPLVAIANYCFDGIPQDAFTVDEGRLYHQLLTVTAPDEQASLEQLSLSWKASPAEGALYGEPELDRVLDGYRDRLGNNAFTLPTAGLRCCAALRRIAGDRLLLLSADKGIVRETQITAQAPPRLAMHGSFSMGVNYHAIGEYFRNAGGELLAASHRSTSLAVVACLLGERRRWTATRQAFEDGVESFGPDDFFQLKRACEPHFARFTLTQTLALLRLADYDARIFLQCLPGLMEHARSAGRDDSRELHRALEKVWAGYFPIGEGSDLAAAIALLLCELAWYPEATEYFERSLAGNANQEIELKLALCLVQSRQFARAHECVERMLARNPAHGGARALRIELSALLPPRPRAAAPKLEVA